MCLSCHCVPLRSSACNFVLQFVRSMRTILLKDLSWEQCVWSLARYDLNYVSAYTCQLSRIMRESHTCGSKIKISRIQTNFSRLTDTSKCNCLKMFEKWSEHLRNNAQDLLEVLWKSLALNWSPKSFCTFGYLWKSSGNLQHSSEVVGHLQRSSLVFWNLRQSSEEVGRSLKIQVLWKISRILLKKSWQVYGYRKD